MSGSLESSYQLRDTLVQKGKKYLTQHGTLGVRNMRPDMEQVRRQFYSAVQRLEAELGCKVYATDDGDSLYLVINCDEFARALVNKVRQNMSQKVSQMFKIDAKAVSNHIVIRIKVAQNG